jgi:hypothetical protein
MCGPGADIELLMEEYWKPTSWLSNYKFENPDKMGPLTKKFMKYVKSANEYGMKATKKGFYKLLNRKLVPGNNCTFFASIKDAGIVELHQGWNGSYTESWYTKGKNWDTYLDGYLRRG